MGRFLGFALGILFTLTDQAAPQFARTTTRRTTTITNHTSSYGVQGLPAEESHSRSTTSSYPVQGLTAEELMTESTNRQTVTAQVLCHCPFPSPAITIGNSVIKICPPSRRDQRGYVCHEACAGNELQLTANPSEIIVGLTPALNLHCTPGLKDDLSTIMLLQISHLVNGTRTPIADVTVRVAAVSHVRYSSVKVVGNIPSWGVEGAYLKVIVSNPGVTDAGEYQCTFSGLDLEGLLTTGSVTAAVFVLDLVELSSEIKDLRQEVTEEATRYENLEEELRELETARGVAFTAYLAFDIPATRGRLTLDGVTVDTRNSFSNGTYVIPETGNYLLVLQIAISAGHVTAELRHNGEPLDRLIVNAGPGADDWAQAETSVVARLEKGEVIDVEVLQLSPTTKVLGSRATLLSGHML